MNSKNGKENNDTERSTVNQDIEKELEDIHNGNLHENSTDIDGELSDTRGTNFRFYMTLILIGVAVINIIFILIKIFNLF